MRCGACGSERLSPLGELSSPESIKPIRLRFYRTGLFKGRPAYDVPFARACRDCGALTPFLSASARRQLDADADTLGDVAPPAS
ncbi:hypothetical protein ACEZDB_02945 [Streptacidiphilus sp. N1-3]|uniref:Uncharacterized protein n=1 Tax=Streptacidiphilus alkalitolerans TaxID=3342712 RepID=A0ABV6WUI6_9ACTN